MTADIITTDRLVLRSVCDADLGRLYDITFSDPEVMFHAFEGKALSKETAADFFQHAFDHDGNGKQLGALILRSTATTIGFSGLMPCSVLGERDHEIGFVLGKEFWRKGYATEIGIAQIEYGVEVAGCKRLLAIVAAGNAASRSVLRKIGMTRHSTTETKQRGIREVYMAQGDTWHKP